MEKIKVLIVDDSAVVRNILNSNLSKFDDIEIVGTAIDPYDARDKIIKLKPQVITLDLEMPRMNGLEFIEVLMEHFPLPIIVISSIVTGNCETSLKALELGALEVVPKPTSDIAENLSYMIQELADKIRAVSKARIFKSAIGNSNSININTENILKSERVKKIIAIGSSTGGTEVIRYILENMPENIPPIIVTQHMPQGFTDAFAKRLNAVCKNIEVREAKNNDFLHNGLALIAPGDFHLMLTRSGTEFKVSVKNSPKVNRFRPSIDVMFTSVAMTSGINAIGVILTGMGEDGAKGLLLMRGKGARTIAQSEKSCVVFGMPAASIKLKAAEFIEDIEGIPKRILQILKS